jgi:predicted nucleic acid-binding protein
MRVRSADATSVTDESLLISSLNATNASLRQLLIALHTYVETRDDADARRLDAMIWAALRRSTERRALPRLG